MAELPGICGPASRPCKISHSSSYPNNIGIYPSEFLPSVSTIWHAVFASQFPSQVDLVPTGGTVLDILLPGAGFLIELVLPFTHTFQSHHHIIFAKTANRLNVPYTLTTTDIDSIDATGAIEIDIGEYVFEAVGVTDAQVEFELGLSDQEADSLDDEPQCSAGCTGESQEDREFRKLFEQNLEGDRLRGVVVNKQGVEYRMDNGTRKSKQGLDQAGLGDLENASYRDGTSRKLEIQARSFDGEGNASEGNLEEGSVVFLHYVAVKEHYIRQRIHITWNVFDPGTAEFASECITTKLSHNVVHYRFYEWDMETEPGQAPQRLAGWRAVESFNESSSGLNFVAPIESSGVIDLADFVIGNPDTFGKHSFDILPAKITVSELQSVLDDRDVCPQDPCSIDVDLNRHAQSGSYHLNLGTGDANDFRASEWFQRNNFSKYSSQRNASAHVFFNVHSKALRKRDIDKFGIERYLAVEIEKDVKNGRITFFPFMDDPDVPNPTTGAADFLDGSNTLFEPIQPVTSYGGNFFAVCGSIGSFPTNPADGLNSYHSFESNRMTERFDEGTRVLVEKNFAVNGSILGPRLITIEGVGGGVRGSVTCLADPTQEFAFAGHTNDDGFLIYNLFSNGHAEEAIRKLAFRPDEESPPFKENTSPTVDQFEPLVGFSGMIGDIPGIQPGKAVAIASAATHTSFTYKTTDPAALLTANPFLNDEQVEEINLPDSGSPLVITASNAYYGSIQIEYDLSEGLEQDPEILILAKLGSEITGAIDGFKVLNPLPGQPGRLQADIRWIRAASFEIIGPRVPHMTLRKVTLRSMSTDKTNDFLDNVQSHSAGFASGSLDDRLIDNNLFFATDVITMSEDEHSNLYVFFNDAEGGISAAGTTDFGGNWVYHYGIVEKVEGVEAINPFAVTSYTSNNCYLFFQMNGKVLCKKIHFYLFEHRDGNLVERFTADVFSPGTVDEPSIEGPSIYSKNGQILRRGVLSYAAAGDLTVESFLEITGKVPGENEFSPLEARDIDGTTTTVRKNPIAISPNAAFTNADINDIFFSAYQKDNGELRLWYMGSMEDGSNQLQCNFSADDGQSWYGLWEFLEYGYNRLRFDSEKNTQFIDRGANADVPNSLEGTDPQEGGQPAQLGINVHWSRLNRHKIDGGESTILSESQVLEISSPYVFYQSATEQVFLFYIYEGCLLCKVFNDAIFSEAASARVSGAPDEEGGMAAVKTKIERQTRAYFVDGSLTSSALREELHRFANDDTEQVMAEGNIVFRYPFAVDNFGDDRTISTQRVCAYSMPTGLVRVFYKHSDSINLKSALWTGTEWWAEDFLRNPRNLNEFTLPDTSDYAEVTGGFGGTGFT